MSLDKKMEIDMPPASEGESPKKFNWTPVILIAILLWLAILVFSLIFFKVIDFGRLLPTRRPVATQPTPPPTAPQVDRDYPALPFPLSHTVVQGVSAYYRLVGKVSEVNALPNGNLEVKLEQQGEVLPAPLMISATQTVVTEKGKGFAAFSLSEIKVGDTLELIYLVDLKTFQTLVTQVQVERGE